MPYVKMQGRGSGKGRGMHAWFEGWGNFKKKKAHSMGPNIRMPRTCVSLPFMWFARMMTWRMYA